MFKKEVRRNLGKGILVWYLIDNHCLCIYCLLTAVSSPHTLDSRLLAPTELIR